MCFGSSTSSPQTNPAPHTPEETYKDVAFSSSAAGKAPTTADTTKSVQEVSPWGTASSGLNVKGM